jgi:hypothetical protein
MATREIPKDEWKSFFYNFNRFHHGWIVNVEVFSIELGAQRETREIPFAGIIAEMGKNGHDCLELILGTHANHHLTHTVRSPMRVSYESGNHNEVIQIEATDGVTTLLNFHHVSLPDRKLIGMLKAML